MPEEGFFRAGRTRPGPNVHGPRTGPSGNSQPGGGSSRRPRWDTDAGITDRDVAALRWLGQQYAGRSDVLRVLLGRLSPGSPRVEGLIGEATLRDVLDRWEDRGLVARDRLLGHLWVAPTVKALRLVGLDVRAWSFVIPQLAHVHAVGVVRLALEPSIPAGGRWLSERELRREAGKSHVPDGAVQLPDDPGAIAGLGLYGEDVDPLPKRVAVEVELTARAPPACARPGPGPAMAAGPGPSTTPRPRSPATWPVSSSASGPAIPSRSTPCPRSRGPATCAPPLEASHDPLPPPGAGPRLAGHPRPADPPRRPPAGRQRPAVGHAGAGLVLPAVHRRLAGWAGGDPASAPLALVALCPGQPRRHRRGTGCDRAGGGPSPSHLRAPALLAVRRPALRLRPPRHPHHRRPVPLGPGRHPGLAGAAGWPAGRLAVGVERRAGRRRRRVEPIRPPPPTHRPAPPRPPHGPAAHPPARPQARRPRLGVALDGDLRTWRQGRYVVPPAQLRGKAMAVVGAPGAGKTVTLLRLAYLAARAGRKVCFADCKGTDPTLVPSLIAAYRLGNPQARVGCWPEQAMDMWRGSPAQVQSRLLAVEQFTEPFYQRVASAGLRLALTAPDMPAVEGSDELLRRLDPDELAVLWEGRPLQLKDIEAIGEHLPGARLRYADFFAALAGAFDRGSWSYEDVDLAVLTVPTLLSKSEADAAMRVVLEDYGHYATGRKPRTGEDALLVLDEFSALASGVDSAINLAERVRDVGVQVVVAAQSVEGLGDHRQAPRLLASCAGGVVVHQCPDPERLLALAGMVRTLEHNWELDFYGPRGLAKARMGDRPRIDPEQVRQAQPGEAWVIQAGHSLHLRVLAPPAVAPEPVELAAALPLADDTIPLPVVEEPAPVGIAAAVALASRMVRRAGQQIGRRRERGGRLPTPVRRPWLPVPPLPGRGRR